MKLGKLLNVLFLASGTGLVGHGVLVLLQYLKGYPHPDDPMVLIVPGVALLGLGLLGTYRLREERPTITQRRVITTRGYKGHERRRRRRREDADNRDSIRWDPTGGERREGGGRRKEDQWDGVHRKF
ncbi:MAG: hypothetical protein ACE5NW_00185 [Acidiferrobacterales bacterium]